MRKDNMTRQEALIHLQELGVSKIVIDFSGGGDEGYIDGYTVFDSNDNVVENDSLSDMANGILSEPIWDEYGSFAGEFYVNGQLTWDVKNKTVKMSGHEEEKTWIPFDKDV